MQLKMHGRARVRAARLSAAVLFALGAAQAASAQNLIVSTSNYVDPGFASGAALPYAASGTTSTVNAIAGSAFCSGSASSCATNVWNNDSADANFGVTGSIGLQQVNTTTGQVVGQVNVTAAAAAQGVNLVTSFASKSELAINVTPDGTGVTFMGYNSTTGQIDVSNSNTPGVIEAGNTDIAASTYRAVGQFNLTNNTLQMTTTNAYNGNNGRAAILGSNGVYYMVGNAGNGNGGTATTAATGVQMLTPGANASATTPGTVQAGVYSTSTAKDNNFRGETIFNNTLYVTKGSGSKGVDTVYQVGTAGTLPSGAAVNTALATANATILPGLNTGAASATNTPHPFGIWFANSTTLYVADEGSGASSDFGSAPTTTAGGLQKYSLVNGTWQLDYELKGTLIGSSYTVNGTGGLAGYALTTTTDGLRNLTGQVNANGTVTLYAVTSTEGSVLGDSGADPNKLVSITDTLSDTTASQATGENFNVLETAALGQTLRGVALSPQSVVPLPGSAWLLLSGLTGIGALTARRKRLNG